MRMSGRTWWFLQVAVAAAAVMMFSGVAHGQDASTTDSAAVAADNAASNGAQNVNNSSTDLTANSNSADGAAAALPASGDSVPEDSQQPASSSTSTAPKPQDNANYVLQGNFFQRLAQFYKQDWAGTNPSTPLPAKRGLPAPLDSGPFPSADWGYGGSPDIGVPDGNTYPLMSALGLV